MINNKFEHSADAPPDVISGDLIDEDSINNGNNSYFSVEH